MRFLWLLVFLSLATWFSVESNIDLGQVTFVYHKWTLSIPSWLLVWAVIGAILLIKIISGLFRLVTSLGGWFSKRNKKQADMLLALTIENTFSINPTQAIKNASKLLKYNQHQKASECALAISYYYDLQLDKSLTKFKEIATRYPELNQASELWQAKILLLQDKSLAVREFYRIYTKTKNNYALLKAWSLAIELREFEIAMPLVEKIKSLPQYDKNFFIKQCEILYINFFTANNFTTPLEDVKKYWDNLPVEVQKSHKIVSYYIDFLNKSGHRKLANSIYNSTHKN